MLHSFTDPMIKRITQTVLCVAAFLAGSWTAAAAPTPMFSGEENMRWGVSAILEAAKAITAEPLPSLNAGSTRTGAPLTRGGVRGGPGIPNPFGWPAADQDMVCALGISSVGVGECTYNEATGQARTLVAVYLTWVDPPAGQVINVTFKGQTKSLNPAVKAIPPFVQFIVPADGSTGTVTAQFSGGACVAAPTVVTLPANCTPPVCGGAGSVGGRVFNDYNNNGSRQLSEVGVQDVTVSVYDDFDQLLCTTTTAVNGLWRCFGIEDNAKVRVEFTLPAKFEVGKPGANSASAVQFGTEGQCNVDLGIFETKDYMDPDPWMMIPCYTKGLVTPGNPMANEPTIVGNRYSTPNGNRAVTGPGGNYYVASASETGTVWGVAYEPKAKALLSAAFMRRHSAFGPGGLGAIYKTDMTTFLNNPEANAPSYRYYGNTQVWLNLDSFGIVTGDETSITRDIPSNPTAPNRDSDVWTRMGKWGLGDMDFNETFDTLFVVNLHNRTLVTIRTGNPFPQNPNSIPASNVSETAIPDPGCSANGDWRPFALKYRNGALYVGGVCTAESTQQAKDMRVVVYKYENGTFNEVVSQPLNYTKGVVQSPCADFIPWSNSWSAGVNRFGGTAVCGPMPMLADIEFDSYGNMILGIGDRAGYNIGWGDLSPNAGDNTLYNGFAGGDIIKLYNNNGQYLMENNGTTGYFTSAGANNGEGLNGGEFYYQDNLALCCHDETILGGLAVHPSDDAVIATVIDAAGVVANGWKMLSNTNGAAAKVYDIFVWSGGDNSFSKAAGLGDIELLQSSSATGALTIQIGNYIWLDQDLDGVQDPSEPPVVGMPVQLYKKVNGVPTPVATTTTNALGQYYFDNLLPNMDYIVVVGNPSSYNTQLGLFSANGKTYMATQANSTTNGGNDENDSDATPGDASLGALAGLYSICFTTGELGENNYTYDFGVVQPGIGNRVWKDDNFNGRQEIGEAGVQGVIVKLHVCNPNGTPGAVLPGYTTVTSPTGYYNFQNMPAGNYALSFDYSGLPNANDVYFSIPNIEGNTVDSADSDVKYVLPGNALEYTACFAWDGDSTKFDYTFDAGIVCDKDFDGVPDDYDETDLLIDPTGYLYCENTGEILDGGLITVDGPGNVYMIYNGSAGYYQFFVDKTGVYTIGVQDPPSFLRSTKCLDLGFLDAPDSLQVFNPYSVGSGNDNPDDFLDDYTCPTNRLYLTMLLEPGDFIVNNNIPYQCADRGDLPAPFATLEADNGPLHGVMQTPHLYMGTLIDKETDGAPEACAGEETGGDDGTGIDDEDGIITMPDFVISLTSTVPVRVVNRTGSTAKLYGFMDYNNDKDFDDLNEMVMVSVPNNTNPQTFNLNFPIPVDAAIRTKIGLRLRLSLDSNLGPNGPTRFGEIEDYVVEILGADLGDLPETYNTSGTDNPPMHRVTPNLKLGASVDAEKDGNPDAMAGSMGGGDDGNVGLVTFGTSNPAGDDENGIMLVSPLMPGMTATLMVDAMNMTGSPAVLQGWIDFNTNGTFEANEQLTTGSFAPSGAVVPNGGLNGAKLTFNVPANATFIGGNAFARFRLSPQGGLAPDSELPDPPFGEIEDYKFPLAKVGNIVFEDYDFDGVQDAGEPGIDGVNVMLTWAGPNGIIGDADDVMYTTTTGPAGGFQTGEYYFCELIAGTYKVKFTTPDHMTPTRSNIGGNVSDSDGTITGMDLSMAMETFTIASTINLPTGENGLGDNGVNPTDTYPDNQVDETHDQGFAFLDYGDLPESGSGDQFNTTMVEGGAVHVIIPGLKLGASVDGERDGAPNAAATGDDITNTGSTDDEDGISFPTPLVPGYNATILVSAMNMTGTNAFLEGWIDWNNNGLLDASEELAFSNNGIIPNGGVTNAPFTFPVPSTAIFNDGMVFARFRLSRTGGLSADGPDKYNPSTTVPQGEVEDYMFKVAKLGNLVFADADADGVQDANEIGIDGVTVQVIWAGPDANINTTGDNVTYETITGPASGKQTGEYYVCGLIAGTYKVVFMTPTHFTVSKWDVGNQTNGGTLDSDGQTVGMDQSMAMELITIGNVTNLPLNENGLGDSSPNNVGTFPDNQTDETHDQGFFGLDYGDLPETGNGDQFSTNMAKTGAIHVVIPALKLGATIDVERDGFPTADALGDDNANHGSADDEDGIVFATPLIPGNSATIRVSAMNMLGANAVLQGWIDWNNNGLLDATEALAFTNGGVVPVGGVTNSAYTFPVPSTAIFNDGMVFARFRLSPAGGLGPNGPDKLSGAPIPFGEVEDYMLKVAKVGNVVWEDLDYDGVQDLTEPGIGNVTMQLLWAGADGNLNTTADNVTYTVTTLAAASGGNVIGEYNFCGLIPGTYKITAITPQDMSPTIANVGSQINGGYLDSDGTGPNNMPMTDPFTITAAGVVQQPLNENGIGDNAPAPLGTFPDNQTNESFDFGFVAIDFGDLPDTYVTDDNPQFSGAQHVIQPLKYLGACVDAETQANIDATGNAGMWVGGDDFTTSTKFYGTCGSPADDENGVVFLTPLVPGYEARVRVTYTALDIPGIIRTGNTYLSGWLDYNNNDQFDAGEQVITDLALATGTNVVIDVPFTVPGTVAFNGGRVRARFRIHCQKGLGSAGLTLGGEVEDYYIPLAKTGNYVWFDNDLRGDEMTTNSPKNFLAETGINDVDMVLVWGGPDGNLQTAADNRVYRKPTFTGTQGENQDGIYYFCGLIGGQYTVVPRKYVGNLTGMGADSIAFQNPILAHPTRKILTIANNAGNDYKDSDGTPAYAFTVPNLLAAPNVSLNVLNENGLGDLPTIYSFPDRLTDLSMDFGFIQEPNIEANQQISGIEKGSVCGQFKIVADLCLTNTGGYENGYVMATPLNSIQANVPLASQLGSAFVMTMGTPQIMNGNWECGEAPLPQQLPQVNPNYNGTTDTRLFLPNTGLLWPGEKVVVRYVFEVRPTNVPEPQSLNLQFQAAAEGRAVNYQGQPIPNFYQGGGQYIAADLSNHTLDLDGTYDDTDIPNSIGPCWKQTQNVSANDLVYVDLDDATCTAEINESMILDGEPGHCIDNAFCLGGYYRFKITDNIGKEVPNPIPAAYVGQMLTVEVENIVSCNKWWGKLIVEDKDAPQLSCADITVSCNAGGFSPDELQALGVANAKAQASDCSTFTLISADDIDFFDCSQNAAFGQRITRVWTATDKWGNKNQCIQTINVQRPTLATIAKPGNYDDLSKPSLDCSGGYPTPAVTGEPVGCNSISYSYKDEVLQVCPSSYTIIRTWTLSDMCSGNTAEHVQTIKVTDKTAPVLFCPDSKDIVVGKSKKAGKSCTATVELPWIQVTDDCSTNDKMTVYAWTQMPDGSLQIVQAPNAGGKFVFEMPVGGIYTFTYSAIDGCGNKNECTVTAAVNDVTPPTVVCETFHVVALSDSVTLVNASSFDDGSSDECTSVTFAVRRGTMNASGAFVQHPCNQPGDFVYADKVRFYCCDGLSATPLFVDLRVRDAWGNDNFCMVPVTVVDKVKPVIWCPENVTVECGMPYAPAQPDTFHTEVEPKMAIANAYAHTYTVPVNVSGIPAEAKLTDLNLQLTITHEATNQLRITLVSPKGTKAEVLNANGCSGQAAQYPANIDVLFDDEAYDVATFNVTGQKVPAAFTCLNANPSIGAYNGGWMVPQGDELKVLDGEGLNGTWQLIVEDTAPLAGGMIHTVGLHLEFASPLAQRPVVTDNTEECGLTLSHIDLGSPDECPDNEFINRRWSVVDAFGNNTNCVQRIYFNDATPLRVNFPCNTTTTCPSDPSNTGEVTHNADCEIPGVEYTDQKLTTTDGCYKILRTWVLKDWCKYQDDGNIDYTVASVNPASREITFTTAINPLLTARKIEPGDRVTLRYVTSGTTEIGGMTEGDVYSLVRVSGTTFRVEWNSDKQQNVSINAAGTGPHIFRYGNSAFGFGSTCTQQWEDDGDGYFSYVQEIKVIDTEAPTFTDCTNAEYCSFEENCGPTAITLKGEATDNCADAADLHYEWSIDANNDGTTDITGTGSDASGSYPLGTHKITFKVTDRCGNWSTCVKLFTIKDCKKPTPVCINGLSVDLMPNTGMATVLATSLESGGSKDNCTSYGKLQFRVERKSTVSTGQTAPDADATASLNVNCDDHNTNGGELEVVLWVGDEAGNWDYCITKLWVQDNMGACGSGSAAALTAYTANEDGESVEKVTVELSGASTQQQLTGTGGTASFGGLWTGQSVTVTPVKDIHPLNGVSTYDLLLIQKHLLGIKALNSPYKLIAADVNSSANISISDIIELRKMILTPGLNFKDNTSWRFVQADYVFANPSKPFGFPETKSFKSLNASNAANFVAVKVGDVSGDHTPNSLLGSETRNSVGTLTFSIAEQTLVAGQEYTVAVRAENFRSVQGYQYTMDFNTDVVEFDGVDAVWADLSEANFGRAKAGEGVLTTSWNGSEGVTLADGEVLYTVTFRAKANGKLSQALKVNSRVTKAEAYDAAEELLDIRFRFDGGVMSGGEFALYQNEPNPFGDMTTIGFELPASAKATLTVYDVTGKVLKVLAGDYAKGYHRIMLQRSELQGHGMLYYRLDTDTDTATKRMILAD